VLEIDATADKVFSIFWDINAQRKWDAATTGDISILEQGNPQLVYMQHKVLSAASAKRDVLISRGNKKEGNTIWCYATSVTSPKCVEHPKAVFTRATQVFIGFLIESQGSKCKATLVSCFDFSGWIHIKFINQEVLRVAQRLVKIKQIAKGEL